MKAIELNANQISMNQIDLVQITILGIVFVLLSFIINAIIYRAVHRNKTSEELSEFLVPTLRSLCIALPIFLTSIIIVMYFSGVIETWIFFTILVSSLLIGLAIFNLMIADRYKDFRRQAINSVFWPLTVFGWSVFKFIVVTPFIIIRNRIVFPIYNLFSWFFGKFGGRPTGTKLLEEIEQNAIYQVKELDNTINNIQTVNYAKDAIEIHSKTSMQITEANKALKLLSEDSIFIPNKYRTHTNVFEEGENELLNQKNVSFNKKEKEYSNTFLAFKVKRSLWKNIGISTRMSTLSDSFIINLIWFTFMALSITMIALLATATIPFVQSSFLIGLSLITIWFMIENYLNQNSQLKASDSAVSKLNERISQYIVALELFEDRLNGFIIRNKEYIEEIANVEYRNEFWHYIVKFGPNVYKGAFNKNYLASIAAMEIFIEDEINDQILVPYSYGKVCEVYKDLKQNNYNNAVKEIFKNTIIKNPSLAEKDSRDLAREYDVPFVFVNQLINDAKLSDEFIEAKKLEIENIRNAIIKKPMLAMLEVNELSEKFSTTENEIKSIVEELFYEIKFSKLFREAVLKEYKNLLSSPLNIRFDAPQEQLDIVSRKYKIEPKVLDRLINSLKSDNNIINEQKEEIIRLRQELELFVYMNIAHRDIFNDSSFMRKYTNALKSDIDFVREKIINQESVEFFMNLHRNSNAKRFELLDSAFGKFKTLKTRNKELRVGDQ